MTISGCSKGQQGQGFGGMPPMPVEVSEATVQAVVDRFEAVGTVEASEGASVVAEIDGLVTKLAFEEGGAIRRGQLIAQLDDAQLAAEVDRAEALRAQGQTTYDRVKNVVDLKAGSPQELDDAAAALKVAEANLALARARLAKTRIVAPFDGSVGARRVSVGTFVRTGDVITELANIDEIRIVFSAPERSLSGLSRDAEVVASSTVFPGAVFDGKIIAVDPVLDPQTRNARVAARVANPERQLRPGMSANVSVTLRTRPDAVTIPNEAIFASGDQSFVFVVNADSTVARAPVTLGTRMADVVEVTDGLKPGTVIVRAGHQKLFDGAKVMAVTSQPPGATSQ
jgi:membrane fusion protein (multidrug efflux system)